MKIILDAVKDDNQVLILNSEELAVILAAVKFTTTVVDPSGDGGLELYRVRNQFIGKFGR